METLLLYILLGIIQGITEPIPVSSSGHLVLAQILFGIESTDASLEILLHAGSLVAIILFYYKDIKDLVISGLGYIVKPSEDKKPHFMLGLKLVAATIPAGLIGLFFKDQLTASLTNPRFVGFALLYTGTLLFISSKLNRPTKKPSQFTFLNAILIGLFQAVALLPGVSRSGSTTTAGLFQGFERDFAMKFSFLLFIPIAIVVIITGMNDIVANPSFAQLWFPYLISTIVSGVVTFYALKVFKNVLKINKIQYFAYYCYTVGLLTILFIK